MKTPLWNCPVFYRRPAFPQLIRKLTLSIVVASVGMLPLAARTTEKADKTTLRVPAAVVTIGGTVTDNKGEPIPGVSIVLKGTATGTTTGAEGTYSLNVPDGNGTLVFSFIGYTTQEVAIGNRTTLNVQLLPDVQSLNEVVVVGYGTQKKGEVTGSVASVKADHFVSGTTRDAGQLLQGKVAGLTISTPSGDPTQGAQILLRGTNSINGNNNPLVLIDGVPGDLRTVAPEDIEQIDVLKDGSSAAIYGTRATNGVILITTRKAREGQSAVAYTGYLTTEQMTRTPSVLSADAFRQHIQDGTITGQDYGGNTDWLREITRKPVTHVHNLTLKAGSAQTSFLANLNYRDVQGIFKNSDNQAIIGRLTVDHRMFKDKLNVNLNFNSNHQKYTTTFSEGFGTNPGIFPGAFNPGIFSAALVSNPTMPVRDDAGNWNQLSSTLGIANPLSSIQEGNGVNSNQKNRVYGNITFTPIEGLRLNALLSTERFDEERGYRETFRHFTSAVAKTRQGFASRGTTSTRENLMELTAQYTRGFGAHDITALAGYGYQRFKWADYVMQNWNFPTDQFDWNNMALGRANSATAGSAIPINSNMTSRNLISFFGRINYNFRDKYLATLSVRHEADSRFVGSNQTWGTFPALSLGWRLNREAFLANATFVNDLKLRAGYGITGIAPNDPYLAMYRLGYTSNTNTFLYNGQWVNMIVPQSNPNPQFTWEKKHEYNAGVDFSLFNNRIGGSVDAYSRQTVDLLYNYAVPVPPNVYGTTLANVGTISNKGLEVLLNVVPLQRKDFEWSSTVNFSTNTNKLTKLNNQQYSLTSDYFYAGDVQPPVSNVPTHRVKVGEPIGQIWGWKVVDITEDGKWVYEGKNGEPVASDKATPEDRQVLGNGLPKFYAGWNNSFRFKNVDLGVTMRGAFKYQIVNLMRVHYESLKDQSLNKLESSYEPVFGKAVNTDNKQFNSYHVENGDFWKIDNITLGYNIGRGSIKGLGSARIYVSTLNTFQFTGYKGMDPEVTRIGLTPGLDDRNKYPTTRVYTLGVNLNF